MDDLISRQAAINALSTGSGCGLICRRAIRALPKMQSKQRWIPIEETLPEDGHEVWVTIKGHDVIYCREGETIEDAVERISQERWVTRAYWSKEENGWNDPTFGCPLIVSPIAWMDIDVPEPYREEQKKEVEE